MRWLVGITDSMDMNQSNFGSCWWTGKPGVLQSMGLQSWTQLSDWTTTALHKGQNLQYLEIAASSHIWIWQHDTWDMTNSHQKIKYEGGFAILSWALKKGVVCLHAVLLPSAWRILMPRASITLSDSMGWRFTTSPDSRNTHVELLLKQEINSCTFKSLK